MLLGRKGTERTLAVGAKALRALNPRTAETFLEKVYLLKITRNNNYRCMVQTLSTPAFAGILAALVVIAVASAAGAAWLGSIKMAPLEK